jgi:uncharacterized protein
VTLSTVPSAADSKTCRILTPGDYRAMPWKNGGGTTTEIHIHPEGAGWGEFDWRVGIADIGQSGPFSSFPGIDRSILLLDCPEGSGMRLTIDGRDLDLPMRAFVDFAGESTTYGTLKGKPVRDFNVMSRRGRVRHSCGFETLGPGELLNLDSSNANFAYIVSGAVRLQAGAGQSIEAGMSILSFGAPVVLCASGGHTRLVHARFDSLNEAAAR